MYGTYLAQDPIRRPPLSPLAESSASNMLHRVCIRRFSSARAVSQTLPVMRLPTTVFPNHCISLQVVLGSSDGRPAPGCVPEGFAQEICEAHGGSLALLADGATAGVVVNIRTEPMASSGNVVHAVGGHRVQLIETAERTRSGGRLAHFDMLADEVLDDDQQHALKEEAVVATSLLTLSAQRGGVIDLMLCTLDEEVGMPPVPPTAHPAFIQHAVQPDEPNELAFWCAARLPLTTGLRHHLLALQCPLKRMRDIVDVMRILLDPSGTVRRTRDIGTPGKLQILYDTAEASGCELEPPRPIVDWAGLETELPRY